MPHNHMEAMANLVRLVQVVEALFLLLCFWPDMAFSDQKSLRVYTRFSNFHETKAEFMDTVGHIKDVKFNSKSTFYQLTVGDRRRRGPPYSMKLELKLEGNEEQRFSIVYDPFADYIDPTGEIGTDGIPTSYYTVWEYAKSTNTILYRVALDPKKPINLNSNEWSIVHFCYLGEIRPKLAEIPPNLSSTVTHTKPLAACSAYDTELDPDPFPVTVVNLSDCFVWMKVIHKDTELRKQLADKVSDVTSGVVYPGKKRRRRAFASPELYRKLSSNTTLELRFTYTMPEQTNSDLQRPNMTINMDISYATSLRQAYQQNVFGVEVIVHDWEKKPEGDEKPGIYLAWLLKPKERGFPIPIYHYKYEQS